MTWCTDDDLARYVLQAYLNAIAGKDPAAASGHIALVSAEIDEALLQGGWPVPADAASATLTRICAVMASWRCVGNITSLMDTEAQSANEWLPLQRLNARAEKDLDAIRAGKLNPFPASDGDGGITVVTKPALFGPDVWDRF